MIAVRRHAQGEIASMRVAQEKIARGLKTQP
jgi:hypothetical protein